MCILARSSGHFRRKKSSRIITDGVLADVELDKGKIRKLSLKGRHDRRKGTLGQG